MSNSDDFNELAQAEVCFAVASRLVYCEPDVHVVAEQAIDRLFSDAPFAADNARVRKGLSLLDDWCVRSLQEAREDGCTVDDAESLAQAPAFQEAVAGLRREWLRLFVGLGTPEASCLESFYVEPNSHMFGKNTLAVREAYRRYGLQVEKLHTEPDDHLGLMLGFLSHVIAKERTAREAGEVAAAQDMAADQEAFLVEHVLPWLAAWRYETEAHASSAYFQGVGDFTFGLCACYAERFNIRFDEEAQAFKKRK